MSNASFALFVAVAGCRLSAQIGCHGFVNRRTEADERRGTHGHRRDFSLKSSRRSSSMRRRPSRSSPTTTSCRYGSSSIPEALELADNLEVAQQNSTLDLGHQRAGIQREPRGQAARAHRRPGRLLAALRRSSLERAGLPARGHRSNRGDQRAPAETLWGANAVNGVINITTKSAKDTQGLFAEAGGGTELEDFAPAVRYGAGSCAADVYFRVYGQYSYRGSEVFSDGDIAPTTRSEMSRGGGFRIDSYATAADDADAPGRHLQRHRVSRAVAGRF